jgi:hypothetical protein
LGSTNAIFGDDFAGSAALQTKANDAERRTAPRLEMRKTGPTFTTADL